MLSEHCNCIVGLGESGPACTHIWAMFFSIEATEFSTLLRMEIDQENICGDSRQMDQSDDVSDEDLSCGQPITKNRKLNESDEHYLLEEKEECFC